jgi:hypothetical protein
VNIAVKVDVSRGGDDEAESVLVEILEVLDLEGPLVVLGTVEF